MKGDLTAAQLQLPVDGRDHVQGRAEAPLILVEYGTSNLLPVARLRRSSEICGAASATA
jgi:hypothetical protein